MTVTVVGVSHHGASLEVRERLAYRPSEIAPLLERIRRVGGAREAVVLSTCNRTELYVIDGDGDAAAEIWTAFTERLGEDASAYGYVHRERAAISHLFRVASGLDSMILGEAQIHGQVRQAWESCREHSGPVLARLFQTALQVAGRVRHETSVGRGAASVSSAAVQIAKQIFGSLAGRRAMVLGAGEMAELALECLTDEGVRTAIVANRTIDRARILAERYDARAIGYDEAWSALGDVDVLLCSTAAPHAVVFPDHLRPAVSARGGRPLCILDIALPRDVEPTVRELENVFLYDLDDLHAVVSESLHRRRAEIPVAEQLVASETERFSDWLAGLSVVPVLTRFRSEMDALRERELDHALRRLSTLTPEQRSAVEQFSRSLMNKFLHAPTVRLRAAATNDSAGGLGIVAAMRYLFALDENIAAPAEDDGAPAREREHHTVTRGDD